MNHIGSLNRKSEPNWVPESDTRLALKRTELKSGSNRTEIFNPEPSTRNLQRMNKSTNPRFEKEKDDRSRKIHIDRLSRCKDLEEQSIYRSRRHMNRPQT
ncbi:hypothetical protein U1Q18_052460 [Sarracenia purpurea var. burkii]